MPLSLTRPADAESKAYGRGPVNARIVLPPLLFLLCLLYGPAAQAEAEFAGKARVVDGVTLEVGGRLVRLFGVTAPSTDGTCVTATGQSWTCGEEAAFALAFETADRWLTCRERFQDAGLVIATCRAGPYDLAAKMVRQGWAVARPDESRDYVADEENARSGERGIWKDGSRPTILPGRSRDGGRNQGERSGTEKR